jgi:hypothetical protein
MGILGGCPLMSSLRSISLSSRKWSSRPPPLANRKGMCSVALSIQNKGDKRLFVTPSPVFRKPYILRRIRILVSVHRISDPDPDPALFISGLSINDCRYIYSRNILRKALVEPVLGTRIRNGIRIRRIRMSLGLPDPDPLVRGTDPAPDPSLFS